METDSCFRLQFSYDLLPVECPAVGGPSSPSCRARRRGRGWETPHPGCQNLNGWLNPSARQDRTEQQIPGELLTSLTSSHFLQSVVGFELARPSDKLHICLFIAYAATIVSRSHLHSAVPRRIMHVWAARVAFIGDRRRTLGHWLHPFSPPNAPSAKGGL